MLRREYPTAAKLQLSTMPVSVNAMYAPGGKNSRHILTRQGRAWKQAAALELNGKIGINPDPSYWRLDVLIPGAGINSSDLPNFEKGLTDILVALNLVPDDRYLVDYRFRFHCGKTVVIALKTEDLDTWAKIKKPSKSLMRKLVKSSAYRQPLL